MSFERERKGGSVNVVIRCVVFEGGCSKTEEEEGPSTEEDSRSFRGSGVCKWFNVRMGFGFLSMTNREGTPLDAPVDVFVHQVKVTPKAVKPPAEHTRNGGTVAPEAPRPRPREMDM